MKTILKGKKTGNGYLQQYLKMLNNSNNDEKLAIIDRIYSDGFEDGKSDKNE